MENLYSDIKQRVYPFCINCFYCNENVCCRSFYTNAILGDYHLIYFSHENFKSVLLYLIGA